MAGGKAVTRADRVGVEKACLAGKTVMLANMTSALGGNRLRGVGKKGAKVGVRFDVRGFENVVGIIKYTGPVHLANSGTRPHDIFPKKRKALSPQGSPWAAAYAEHPGTRGKKFAEKSERIVLAKSKQIIAKEVNAHLARTFTGR